MTRTIRYQEVAAELRSRVGSLGSGNLLPSESALAATFEVSRVTVRRALELLRDEGLVNSRQGFGWYVFGSPLRQRLDELLTIEGELQAHGIDPARRILDFAFEVASRRVESVLGAKQILRVRRLNLADGEPFAIVTVWCPAELGHRLSRRAVEVRPFYELLGVQLRGAIQTIRADAANPEVAEHLHVRPGSPVLRCERITTDISGRAVLLSEHLFPAHRTEFVVDLPHAAPSSTPSGLRIVEDR